MIINKQLLDHLTELAKQSPRLRYGLDMRTTPDDQSQRLLNALEQGTVMPIHRHLCTSETVVIIRGKLKWIYYDNDGKLTNEFYLEASGDVQGISVPKGQWHSLDCLESGTVIMEAKDGPWTPLTNDEIMVL